MTDLPPAKKRVLITCSAKGGVPWWWFSSYDRTLRLNHPEYEFEFAVEAGNTAINISRNIAAQNAIEQNYWKLVQIDCDQFWTPEGLVRLVGHKEAIVAAPYCKKRSGPVKWLMVSTPGAVAREDGMLQCDFMGTGMFCTEVAALRKMVEFFPERRFVYQDDDGKEKEMTELFPIGLVGPNTPDGRLRRIAAIIAQRNDPDWATYRDGALMDINDILTKPHPDKARFLGEDYHFGHLARKAGLTLWCDTRNIVGHVGDIVYPVGNDKLSESAGIPTHTLKLDDW